MSEEKGNGKLVKIGGALIILAAFGIMLPAVFQYVAGIGRMVILIVVALGFAYLLNMMMARQALERMRRAKAASAGGTDGQPGGAGAASAPQANGKNGTGDASETSEKN
ncbi:MAG: hypothetical protein K2Y39_06370 [Candidatus Obscuribacterales bacterium]|nr:hypothetical protein [Candidatus Obscuribacterales bacterium]